MARGLRPLEFTRVIGLSQMQHEPIHGNRTRHIIYPATPRPFAFLIFDGKCVRAGQESKTQLQSRLSREYVLGQEWLAFARS